MTTTGAKALSAFNTFSGAFGLGTSLIGLFTPDPLQDEIDAVGRDLAEIKGQLTTIGNDLTRLRGEVADGFDQEFSRDLNGALAEVDSAKVLFDRYKSGDYGGKPKAEAAGDVVRESGDAVRDLLYMLRADGLADDLSAENAENMISALNFAVSLRLTVAQELEDGAIGQRSIKNILTNAATATDSIIERLDNWMDDPSNYVARQYNPVSVRTVTQWTGTEIANAFPYAGGDTYRTELMFKKSGDRLWTQSQWEDQLGWFDPSASTIRSNLVDKQTTWRPTVTNVETGHVETFERTVRYRDADHGSVVNGLNRTMDSLEARHPAAYHQYLSLTQLGEVSETFRSLAAGEILPGGTARNDLLNGTDGYDYLFGLEGADVINAGASDDVVRGGEGNDIMRGEGGADVLDGGAGNDRAEGGADDDVLYGGDGRDILNGGTGADQLLGGDGADYLNGGAGADMMAGGRGNDFYVVGHAGDEISGEIGYAQGGGIDTVRTYINNYVQPDNIELVRVTGLNGTQNFNATGNHAPGTLVGNAGNNVLTGRGGNDKIKGNDGDDRIIGNTGRDLLSGGAGADTFVYTSVSDSRAGRESRDFINGFERGADKIDLSDIDANLWRPGEGSFDFIGFGGFTGNGASSAGELRLQSLGGANAVLIEADLRGNGEADMQIFVNLTTTLGSSDFIL